MQKKEYSGSKALSSISFPVAATFTSARTLAGRGCKKMGELLQQFAFAVLDWAVWFFIGRRLVK